MDAGTADRQLEGFANVLDSKSRRPSAIATPAWGQPPPSPPPAMKPAARERQVSGRFDSLGRAPGAPPHTFRAASLELQMAGLQLSAAGCTLATGATCAPGEGQPAGSCGADQEDDLMALLMGRS